MQRHTRFKVVGIVGAGLMGRGIAQVVAQAGFAVRLFDGAAGAAASAQQAIADIVAMLATRGKISAADADAAAARITRMRRTRGPCRGPIWSSKPSSSARTPSRRC